MMSVRFESPNSPVCHTFPTSFPPSLPSFPPSLHPQVPSVLTPVQIPASESLDNVATVLVDTAGSAHVDQLVAKIRVSEGGREGGREDRKEGCSHARTVK